MDYLCSSIDDGFDGLVTTEYGDTQKYQELSERLPKLIHDLEVTLKILKELAH